VTFCLSPSYGFLTARDAHDWFLPHDAQLTRRIPWLRVFVEGVVIVGKLEN